MYLCIANYIKSGDKNISMYVLTCELLLPFFDAETERFFEEFLLDLIGLSFWGCCLPALGWFWKIAGLPIGPKGLEAMDIEAPLIRNTSIFRELFVKVTPRHFVRSMLVGLLLIFNLLPPTETKLGCNE